MFEIIKLLLRAINFNTCEISLCSYISSVLKLFFLALCKTWNEIKRCFLFVLTFDSRTLKRKTLLTTRTAPLTLRGEPASRDFVNQLKRKFRKVPDERLARIFQGKLIIRSRSCMKARYSVSSMKASLIYIRLRRNKRCHYRGSMHRKIEIKSTCRIKESAYRRVKSNLVIA